MVRSDAPPALAATMRATTSRQRRAATESRQHNAADQWSYWRDRSSTAFPRVDVSPLSFVEAEAI
jgi:hypothetical protein